MNERLPSLSRILSKNTISQGKRYADAPRLLPKLMDGRLVNIGGKIVIKSADFIWSCSGS